MNQGFLFSTLNKKNGTSLAHSKSEYGHRRQYLDLFLELFSTKPTVGPLNGAMRKQLFSAERVIISMIDDDVVGFIKVALLRSVLAKPTAAFFLRPQSCFHGGVRATIKRRVFYVLKRLPGLTIITITPFDVSPEYSSVAHTGVCDPQYWDLIEKGTPRKLETELSLKLARLAAGRPVYCALGRLDASKGITYLAEILERMQSNENGVLWVCAGPIPKTESTLVDRLTTAGALVVDRFLTDAEIESLYGISTAVWACYAPDRDQASGIFGRAIQFGVPAIVRKGSLVERFAARHKIDVIPIEYAAAMSAAARLMENTVAMPDKNAASQSRVALITGWRRQFIETLTAALEGRKTGVRH